MIAQRETIWDLAARLSPQEHDILARARERGHEKIEMRALSNASRCIEANNRAAEASYDQAFDELLRLAKDSLAEGVTLECLREKPCGRSTFGRNACLRRFYAATKLTSIPVCYIARFMGVTHTCVTQHRQK